MSLGQKTIQNQAAILTDTHNSKSRVGGILIVFGVGYTKQNAILTTQIAGDTTENTIKRTKAKYRHQRGHTHGNITLGLNNTIL